MQDTLSIVIRAHDQVTANVAKMDASLKGLIRTAASMPLMLAGATGAVAAVGIAMLKITKTAAEFGDQLAKASTRTGLTTEALSGLKLSAELSDTTLGDVTRSISFMNRALVEAGRGSDEQIAAFRALGIEGNNLTRLAGDPAKALETVASQLLRVENSANRDAIAFRIFGRSAQEILPFLKDLSDNGIKGVIDRAEQFGLKVGAKFAQDSEQFMDNLTRMGFVLLAFATKFSPAIEMANALAEKFGLVERSATDATRKTLAAQVEASSVELKRLEGLKDEQRRLLPGHDPDTSKIDASLERQRQKFQDLRRQQIEFEKGLLVAGRKQPSGLPAPSGILPSDTDKKAGAAAGEAAEKARKAIEAVTKSLETQVTQRRQDIIALLDGEQAAVKFTLAQQTLVAEAELLANKITITPAIRASWDALTTQALDLNQTVVDLRKHLEDVKGFDATNLDRALKEVTGRETLTHLSQQVSDIFLTDRQKDLVAVQRWAEQMREQLAQIVVDAPALRAQVDAISGQIPEAIARQLAELSPLVKTLDQLAAGMFDGLIDRLTGAIQHGETLSDVLKSLGSSLALGLNRAVLQAAFAPLQEILHETFVGLARGGSGGIGKILGGIVGSIVGAFGGGAGASVGSSVGGIIGSAFEGAQGGILKHGFEPLHGFRLRKFAAGGIADRKTWGVLGESGPEAVIPLQNGAVPVHMQGGGVPNIRVEILGDVTPRHPGMTREDVVRVFVEDFSKGGATRNIVQKHGR